ncbi:MAG: azurin [Verrucomicrobiales bacterium]|jgi:azurin
MERMPLSKRLVLSLFCLLGCLQFVRSQDGASNNDAATVKLGTVPGRMEFDRRALTVDPGVTVTLVLRNTDSMQHNWVLCLPGKEHPMEVAKAAWMLGAEAVARNYVPDSNKVITATEIVNPGESGSVTFVAPKVTGAYPYVCTLPGHAMTMQGILYVGMEAPAKAADSVEVLDFPGDGYERAKQLKRSYLRYQNSGRVFSGTLFLPDTPLPPVQKGIAIRVGEHGEGGIVFDTDLMRVGAGWTGHFIKTTDREDEATENRHNIGSAPEFVTTDVPGWANPENGDQADPRPRQLGPLPDKWALYRGYYLAGNRVVLSYSVGDREILESPWIEAMGEHQVFSRTFHVGPSDTASRAVICSAPDAYDFVKREVDGVTIFKAGRYSDEGLAVAVTAPSGGNSEAGLSFAELSRIELQLPASKVATTLKVSIATLHHSDLSAFSIHVKGTPIDAIVDWTKGGAAHWEPEVVTKGELGIAKGKPYVVDTLTLPYENPWNALMYASGHDFFPKESSGTHGDAAVCMSHGDVWIVRGIDDQFGALRWKRFATGLSSPLGLKIVDNQVYVTCHDQITRLHDLNGDGEADFYENFNNDCQVTRSHHRFATNLDTDLEGNFYYTKCTEEGASDHGGSVLRVAKDGSSLEVIATGLRNPNGLAIGPNGLITYGKQQGGWIPSSGIQVVKEGGFHGYLPAHHRSKAPTDFEQPLCWIPHGIDNSCGGQAWVPTNDQRWGQGQLGLEGTLLHFSYGKCSMFLVPHQQIDGGAYQGAVIPFPDVSFRSSAMRARFRPSDGQLYVSGLRGWQTSAQLSGALHRVRYTGEPLYMATGFRVQQEGLRIDFSQPVDAEFASRAESYAIQQWNYRWTSSYGSKDYSVANPDQQGRDPVAINEATLSKDRRSVLLTIPSLKPVMQIEVKANLTAADGNPLPVELYGTIHAIPESKT